MNPIGVHFIPTHTGQHHYNFIRDMQPGILKLVGSSTPDVQQIADGYANAPGALMYLRNVARSEQHDFLWREPAKAAHQHVTEWHADLDERYAQARERGLSMPPIEQLRILGVNEPVLELFSRKEDMSNYDEWLAMMNERAPLLDTYMVEFGLEANRLGYGAGLGNISSGQPANKKPGEYATFDWFPKTRKLLESTRGKNAYTSHEYWRAETGPEGHADWHAWRFMHLDFDGDIDILESGVDQKITDENPNGNRGWVGHMDAKAYVDQHRRYIARARTDSRFRCETPFTLDGDKIWESFWIEYCMPEMVALSNEVRASASPIPPPPGPTTPLWVTAPSGVNLRESPNTKAPILLGIPCAEKVDSFGTEITAGALWNHVIAPDGQQGWILGSLLSPTEPTNPGSTPPVKPPTSTPTTGIIEPRVAQAILQVESGGRSFGADGSPLIRFEAHIFGQDLNYSDLFFQHFKFNEARPWTEQQWRPTINDSFQPIHDTGQAGEYAALELAKSLNTDAAYSSISMGAPQIMGFNHARIGYPSAQAMYNAFKDANMQTIGFINFLLSDPALAQAMRDKDWRTIAKLYNGTANVDAYSKLLQDAYNALGAT